MVTTLQPKETGGYSNNARLMLFHRVKNLNENTVCYNRETWKGWGIEKRPINRWVFAFTANSIKEVSAWKVDTGGGQTVSFEPVVKLAIHEILKYNAAVFFASATPSQIEQLVAIIFARKGGMSLYAFMDAMECFVQREAPCDTIKASFAFDAGAILNACDLYQAKARAEYYEWKKSMDTKEFHDIPKGAPVPDFIVEARQRLEQKFGVVYDENDSRDAMRAAAERFKAEQSELKFD